MSYFLIVMSSNTYIFRVGFLYVDAILNKR